MKKLFNQPFYNEVDKGGGGSTEPDTTNVEEVEAPQKELNKGLSEDEVKKMIQSETDRVRGEYSKKLKEKDKELEELLTKNMTEEEKKERMLNEVSSQLEQRENELKMKELKLETVELLKQNDLPLETMEFLTGSDIESTKENIENFKNMFNKALEDAVTERLKSTSKNHTDGNDNKGHYTMDDIRKMTPDEINKNWERIQRDLSK